MPRRLSLYFPRAPRVPRGSYLLMPPITLEQSLFHRPDRAEPQLIAKSSGFDDAWLPEAERLVLGFGERIGSIRCPLTVFGQPVTDKQVAIVRVMDASSSTLQFHFLVVDRKTYEA